MPLKPGVTKSLFEEKLLDLQAVARWFTDEDHIKELLAARGDGSLNEDYLIGLADQIVQQAEKMNRTAHLIRQQVTSKPRS